MDEHAAPFENPRPAHTVLENLKASVTRALREGIPLDEIRAQVEAQLDEWAKVHPGQAGRE